MDNIIENIIQKLPLYIDIKINQNYNHSFKFEITKYFKNERLYSVGYFTNNHHYSDYNIEFTNKDLLQVLTNLLEYLKKEGYINE